MPDELSSFYTEIEKKFGEPESSGFQWKPSSLINITGDKAKSLFNLLDDLENDEDVQQVFSNLRSGCIPLFSITLLHLTAASVSYTHLTLPTNREV